MKTYLRLAGAFLAVVGALAGASTAAAVELDDARTTANIRISLPTVGAADVSVTPGDSRVLIELPRGAVFPLDFAESSGGLLRGGEVVPLEGERVRLELELAQGLLDRVDFEADAVVLRFVSRFASRENAPVVEDQYLLGPDDKIVITVHNHPELTAEVTVTREGLITAPFIGDVMAAGYSTRQLAANLAERLGRDYLVNPQIDVDIADYRSQWVMVSGEVRLPGRVPLTGGTRLKEALSEAGGFTDDAGERIIISRSTQDGEERTYVERVAFETGEMNPVLRDGDIVDVIPTAYCYVTGEVRNPTRVRVDRSMTLLKALTIAGGLTDWADRKSVFILPGEEAPGTNGHVADGEVSEGSRTYNIKRIQTGKAADPRLRGGEIVVVKRRFF
jgi:polysaccharide export outer membrane protein